jgi:hypothetical protein
MEQIPDARRIVGMDTYEGEAQRRLNPYGPVRPSDPSERPTPRERLRLLWQRVRTLLGRKQGEDTRPN